ncbi:MBL fold metallo-hydrolase [Anaeromicropila herbilytica]|uniref:MBL fold metallo-hydrolase n=1 Tax=Anaeromicropila herbilytica TaxID=2785025 RepID=A0A7R7EHT7_9FIRM|nr:MBL fold metallo-hydrolase [Anaeromicropila herbilytica]BCN29485.1 MBL fold metallo-hydrolase [Anaeromicropila herbilytica]
MEQLIMLGTGNATVTKCYNTCFAIKDDEYFLVDTGGGNGILAQLEKAEIPTEQIHHIFISHEHTDHLLGVIWLIRVIATKMKQGKYDGNLNIYCHADLVNTIHTIAKLTVQKKFFDFIGDRILLTPVDDKEVIQILNYSVQFFDIGSTKAKQYGFTTTLQNGKKFTFLGDEPYKDIEFEYAKDADWLLHEAFCLYEERDIFKPYEKHHSTVKDTCKLGEELNVKNLILYHTEDKNIENRKALYLNEGKEYYHGNLFVPEDLEVIKL